MLLGYAHVSRADDQDTAPQVALLREAGCRRVVEERASGGRWDRPALHGLLGDLREGDILVVWKLDRLSRSLKDTLALLETIEAAGAGFRSLTEAIDTSGPAGRMMMQMLGAFAEFERAMVRERTRTGLDAARARGRVGGRRPKLGARAARGGSGHARGGPPGRRGGARLPRPPRHRRAPRGRRSARGQEGRPRGGGRGTSPGGGRSKRDARARRADASAGLRRHRAAGFMMAREPRPARRAGAPAADARWASVAAARTPGSPELTRCRHLGVPVGAPAP